MADKVVLKKLSQLSPEIREESGKILADMIEATCKVGDLTPEQLLKEMEMVCGGDPAIWRKKSEEL